MAKRIVKLTFVGEAIKKPLTFRMAKKFDVMPNIRRARVTDKIGEIVLELDGKEKDLEKGIKYLIKSGVVVEPIGGDVIE
ncbi:MAG TPA: ferredoxin [Candidatus Omnitrophica bacterium]|nr:ferredoxin [Candidatus Omnitrophota bacterium]